jgi:hypothetical protein
MPEVFWIGWYSVMHPCFLFRPFGSGESGAKLYSLLPSGDIWSMMKSEMENIMKAGLGD